MHRRPNENASSLVILYVVPPLPISSDALGSFCINVIVVDDLEAAVQVEL